MQFVNFFTTKKALKEKIGHTRSFKNIFVTSTKVFYEVLSDLVGQCQ
jgi:hypothetical protein